jgi:hypothetical protein
MNRNLVSIAMVSIVTILLMTGCALPESEQLRKENVDLKAQLETVTQERDALKVQIESIRRALEAPAVVPESGSAAPTSTAPDSSSPDASVPNPGTPSEVAPANPSSSDSGVLPAPAEKAPETPAPEKPATEQPLVPQSMAPEATDAKPETGGAAVTTSPLYQYANKVMEAATAFRVQTQQLPPLDCSLGYSAGQNTVERSTQVKRCEVQSLENNQYRVRLEGIDGSVVIAP